MARPLSTEARDKMVLAAQQLIGDLGVEGFTVDEVARRSGVAKTTIYRHFPNPNDLAVEAIDCMVEPFEEFDTGDLRTDLLGFFGQVLPHMHEPEMREAMAGLFSLAARQPEFGRVHKAMIDERKLPMRRAIQRAIARGEVDPAVDLELVIDMFEAPLIYRRILLDETVTPQTLEQMVDFVLRAIRP